jgi:cell division cycle 20-like protein 1 (cofactor of APC complex)
MQKLVHKKLNSNRAVWKRKRSQTSRMETVACTSVSSMTSASVLQHTMSNLSPAARLKVHTSQAQTPTTQASSTPASVGTNEFSISQRLEDSSARGSSRSIRLSLPSPARSRLDHHYAKRLSIPVQTTTTANSGCPPRGPAPSSSMSSSSGLVPPPGITRDCDYSIFRPVPAVTSDMHSDSMMMGYGSIHLSASPRKYNFSLSRDSSLQSSFGSGSSSTPIRRRTRGPTAPDLGTSDRFIPSRATSNLNINLWDSMSNKNSSNIKRNSPNSSPSRQDDSSSDANANTADDSSNTNTNGRSQDTTSSYHQNLHNVLLRSELLGENISPYSNVGTPGIPRLSGVTQPLRDGRNRLRFQSPRQAYQENIFNEMVGPTSVVNSFGLTPIGSAASQRLMAAPQKRRRRIAKVPFKVLDAPALQDDFYLNLVDWSSQNVLAVGLGSCVYLWSACTSKVTKLCDLAQTEDIVTSVSWAQRGTHLAVGTNRGEVQLWDTIKCKKIRTMAGHSARVGTLAWTGPYLASGSRDRLVFLRDVRVQAAFTDRLSAHKQEVCGLKWSYDEPAFLASGGNDNQLHVVDSRNTAQPIHRFTDHTAAVKAIAWSPHQHGLLASGGGTADRCIRFWNTLSGSALNTVDTGSQVCNLAWSQNCNEIVSTHGYSLNQIVVWRYPSLSKVVTLTGHTYRVLYLAVSPDGSTIVTGAGDETLRFWQVFPGPRSDAKNNAGGLLFPNTLGSVIR